MFFSLTLILASASPRRKQLLTEAGFVFETKEPADEAEDERLPNELPDEYVKRLAFQKAKNVADHFKQGIILGADTIVLCGENILEKPSDRDDAQRMLRQLRGNIHEVLSGLCLIKKIASTETVTLATEKTRLMMQPISDNEIESYLDTERWQGKSGALGYQDGNEWIDIIEGSASNVVGLPLELLHSTLTSTLTEVCS